MSENVMKDGASIAGTNLAEGTAATRTSALREEFEGLARRLAESSEQRRNFIAKIGTMRQSQRAAQGEAEAARVQWAAKLRESHGTLTRGIQKLRATERSALSLVEEYRDIATELESELPRIDLELAAIASDAIQSRNAIVKEAATEAYDQLLVQAGDAVAMALRLFSMAENAGVLQRMTKDQGELAREFFGRLNVDVCRRLAEASVAMQAEQRLQLPPLDLSDVDRELIDSPAARGRRQRELRAGSAN